MSESFWQKNRLVTHLLFDLCLFEHFSPVANFGQQSLTKFENNACNIPWFDGTTAVHIVWPNERREKIKT